MPRAIGLGRTVLEFTYPWILFVLPLPLLVRWWVPPYRESVSALRVPFFAEIAEAVDQSPGAGAVVLRRPASQMVAMIVAWVLIVLALAGPEWVEEAIERHQPARDVMLAIDLSGSMDSVDFPDEEGNRARRLDVVQRVADRFIAERDGDRVGLIVFGTRPYVQLPFTRDLATARALLGLMEIPMAGPQTAIGDAIGLAIKTFESSEVEQRLLILLTDGHDTASKMAPLNAADIARLNGVSVFTIGIGDAEAEGEDRVDFDTLKMVARRTGGEFFEAQDQAALAAVYRRIDEMAPQQVRSESFRPRRSLVHWPAGAAVVLALFATAATLLRRGTGRAEP